MPGFFSERDSVWVKSDRDGRFDRWVRVIIFKGEIFVLEPEKVLHRRVEPHARKRLGLAGQLQVHLLQMVQVNMCVPEREDKIPGLQAGHLRGHQKKQRVRGDIEGNAQERVGAPLVKLERKHAVSYIKLK